MKSFMRQTSKFLLISALLTASAFAHADPGSFLKADGMWGHVKRALVKPGSGPHAKDPVVRVEMLGDVHLRERAFVAYTERVLPTKEGRPAGLRYQFVKGHVDMKTGAVLATSVERGQK